MKLAFLAVLIIFLALPLAQASVGIGVSDYNLTVTLTSQTSIKVGKVTNIGNETLIFSYSWQQTNSTVNMTLPVTPGINVTLTPHESFEPQLEIGSFNESFVGNYSGIIQVTGSYPTRQGGNVAVPAAQLHLSLNVPASANKKQQDPTFSINLVVFIAILVCLIITVVGIYVLSRKKQDRVVTGLVWRKMRL